MRLVMYAALIDEGDILNNNVLKKVEHIFKGRHFKFLKNWTQFAHKKTTE